MNLYALRFLYIPIIFTCANSHAQSIKVVTEESSYSYLKNGKMSGAASEIVRITFLHAGLSDYKITLYPWARAYDLALQESGVLIYPIIRTPARESHFKWIGELARVTPHLYKLRERSDIVINTLLDAKNYSIGVVREDSRQQYLQDQGFTKMVISASNADNFKKLLSRQVQLVPMPEQDVAFLCEEAHIDIETLERVYSLDSLSSGIYLAYSISTPDTVVAQTRESFERLKADGFVEELMSAKLSTH